MRNNHGVTAQPLRRFWGITAVRRDRRSLLPFVRDSTIWVSPVMDNSSVSGFARRAAKPER